MREIKFKALSNEKLYDCHACNFEASTALIDIDGWASPQWCKVEKFLQYIGQRDKNGVEIYEGDRVRCKLYWNGESKEEEFVVEYGKYPYRKIAGFFPFYGTLNAYEVTPLQVIGNITRGGSKCG